MTTRSILGLFDGQYRLRLSRPGYNATDTTLESKFLAFDSTWLDSPDIHMVGTVTAGYQVQQTISFGKTFDYIPMVMWQMRILPQSYRSNSAQNIPLTSHWTAVKKGTVGVYRDKFIWWGSVSQNGSAVTQQLHYIVFNGPFIS